MPLIDPILYFFFTVLEDILESLIELLIFVVILLIPIIIGSLLFAGGRKSFVEAYHDFREGEGEKGKVLVFIGVIFILAWILLLIWKEVT